MDTDANRWRGPEGSDRGHHRPETIYHDLVGPPHAGRLYHNKIPNMDADWTHDSFAPVPAFVDTGSVLIDKTNVESFQQTKKP